MWTSIARWSVRPDVLHVATVAFVEAFEMIVCKARPQESINTQVSFNEWTLKIELRYHGTAIAISDLGGPPEVNENSDKMAATHLAVVFLTHLADHVQSYQDGQQGVLKLRFIH